jgi:Protein of unknown function (DUF1091)
MFGNYTVLKPLTNDIDVNIFAYKKQGGEYRLMPYKIHKRTCDLFQQDIYFYEDMCKYSTHPYPYPCPFPVGTIQVNGFTPSLKNMPNTVIPSGDYRLRHISSLKGKPICTWTFWVSIIQI